MTMSLSLKIVTPFLAWSGKDGILFSVQSPSAGRLAPTCTTQLASLLQVTLDQLESHAASISTTGTSDSLQFPTRHLPFPLHGLTLSSLRRLCLFALQFLFL